jgi:hypothetical protein
MDHACLYVSDFGFSFLVAGGARGGLSGPEGCLVEWERIFAFAAGGESVVAGGFASDVETAL